LATQIQQRGDCHDRDQSEEEGILSQALPFFVPGHPSSQTLDHGVPIPSPLHRAAD
jgi:hypothetical protein